MVGIGDWDWGLGLEIGIGDWNGRLGLGIGIGIGDWDRGGMEVDLGKMGLASWRILSAKNRETLDPSGYDLQQTPMREGSTESLKLRNGKTVITRTWDSIFTRVTSSRKIPAIHSSSGR